MLVKNKCTQLHALSALEDYLRRKTPGFVRLQVTDAYIDNPLNNLERIVKGTDNPFTQMFNKN